MQYCNCFIPLLLPHFGHFYHYYPRGQNATSDHSALVDEGEKLAQISFPWGPNSLCVSVVQKWPKKLQKKFFKQYFRRTFF